MVIDATYFYNNHPIRYVSLLGLIVARTDVFRRTILTLDDSSGATIEVAVLKAEPPQDKDTEPEHVGGKETNQQQHPANARGPAQQVQEQAQKNVVTVSHIATTQGTPLDISALHPGTLAHVKGTLSTFRGTMQLQLERVFPVPDTNAEMRFIDQRLRYLVEVLSVPWWLGVDDVERLREEAEEEDERVGEEQDRVRRRARRKAEREERDQRRIWKMWETQERAREREAGVFRREELKFMREMGYRWDGDQMIRDRGKV